MKRRVVNHSESWASLIPFRIANYEWDDYPSVVCEIAQDGIVGWGEALGVYYNDETEKTMLRELEAVAPQLEAGATRTDLLELLPAGGARNAADAADEAVRLLRRRYEEGMATVADLLQAEAVAASLTTGVVDAEANLSVALAALDFVLGSGAGFENR